MCKSKQFRILIVNTVFIFSLIYPYTQAVGQVKKADGIPSVHATKTFLIYAKKGNFIVFDHIGKIVNNAETKDFRNGELLFIITGPKSAIFSTNTGMQEVEFVRNTNSVTFIETTPARNKHILVIEDKWDRKEGGFNFIYTRNIQVLEKTLRSVYIGIAKPILLYNNSRKPNQVYPTLRDSTAFTLFNLKGNFKTFDIETGKLLKNGKTNMHDGDIMFMITSPKSATMFGNVGSAKVELFKDENFLTFIETTPLGNKHIMLIVNEWDVKEQGFNCIYVRNIEERILTNELMRSIFKGIAKPVTY
ncbi:hypothetical protein JT359_13980 [Candidatus Poribacteria bacterium]|nr:hypothetical protein [Candidatus Poribacteria bacterium]